MLKLNSLILCSALSLSQLAHAADSDCQGLGNALVSVISAYEGNSWLRLNFDDAEVCIVQPDALEFDESYAANYHLSTALDELAIQATVEGYAIWLRVDSEYDGELLLDRATSEGLGLTAAEFLGDNSQLEASDFFIEFVGTLEIAGVTLRDVETNIPLLEAPYDHYAGKPAKSELPDSEAGFLTVGSIGEELLEELDIILDVANQRIYMTEAR